MMTPDQIRMMRAKWAFQMVVQAADALTCLDEVERLQAELESLKNRKHTIVLERFGNAHYSDARATFENTEVTDEGPCNTLGRLVLECQEALGLEIVDAQP